MSSSILDTIVARKGQEIASAKSSESLTQLQQRIAQQSPLRDFYAAIVARVQAQQPAVIAESKRASPSKGLLRAHYDVAAIARSYAAAGATCLSILTDQDFFQGDLAHLAHARNACGLPLLRKDFVLDPYQIWQARAYGADAILLIAACLDDAQLEQLADCAAALEMTVLFEVHDQAECARVLPLLQAHQRTLLGINNRNLHTFDTRLATTIELQASLPADTLIVSESGIHHPADLAYLQQHGVWAYLIGERFMKAPDAGRALLELIA